MLGQRWRQRLRGFWKVLGGQTARTGNGTRRLRTRLHLEELESRLVLSAPSVLSIARAAPLGPTTSASSVDYTVTFNEAVTGVDATDFHVALTGSVQAAITQVTPVSASVYTVTVGNITGAGTLGLNLVDDNSIRDLAGDGLVPLNASPSFSSQTTYATGTEPYNVVVADVNGDGKPDLVVSNGGDTTVGVLPGNGDGTFQTQQTVDLGYGPFTVAVADLNGDGKPDLVAPIGGDSDTVATLLGNGDGTFQSQQNFLVGAFPRSLAVADVNGDGKPDVIVANELYDTVGVLLGNGDGSLQGQQTFAVGVLPDAVAVADLNGDGKPDIITANQGENTVSVLFGNGNGTFQSQQTFTVGESPFALAVADVNGDGNLDLVTANIGDSTASVLLGDGKGHFQPATSVPLGSQPLALGVADVNGDGKADLIVTSLNNTVSVLPGNGDGTFQAQQTFATGADPSSVAVADVNGDGRPDLIVANQGDSTAGVLLNALNGDFTGQVYNIVLAPTTTTLVASPQPAATGQSITFTADVTSNGAPVTSGTVTFREGSTILASNVPLDSNGQAQFVTADLPDSPVAHVISADYHDVLQSTSGSGSATSGAGAGKASPRHFASSSGSVSELVHPAFTISGASTVAAGATYTLNLSVNPPGSATITFWTINWGDGTIDPHVPGNATAATTATHVYSNAPNSFQVTATATTAEYGVVPANAPLLVTVLTPAVAVAKAAVVAPGSTTTLDIPGQTGLTATLTNAGRDNQNLTLFVALYQMNPTGVPMNAAAFFDVRVSSTRNGQPTPFIPAGTTLVVTFRFPPTVANPTLLFFDSSTGTYKPVKSSPPPPGVQLPDPAPGEITVVFDRNSFPAITDLGGTVFAIALQNPAADRGSPTPADSARSDSGVAATGPVSTGTAGSAPVTINTNLSPAVAIALTREGNQVTDAGSGLSASVTFKSSNNLSLNLTASQDSVAAPVASAVGNEGTGLTPEQAAQFVSSLGDLKDQFVQTSGMVFRWVSDVAAILAEPPPARVPAIPAESMKPDNPEDEETDSDTTSATTTATLTRSASEEIPLLVLWPSMEARSVSEGTEARSASEGILLQPVAPAEESKLAALPAWFWAGLALGWIPSSHRGERSGRRRRGLRHEEAKR
jgi:hypothetical protein